GSRCRWHAAIGTWSRLLEPAQIIIHEALQVLPRRLVDELTVLVELGVRMPDEHIGMGKDRAYRARQNNSQMGLRASRAHEAARRTENGRGFAPQRRVIGRPRHPVDRVLEYPGNA